MDPHLCYLVGTAAFARWLLGTWSIVRLTIAAFLVVLAPVVSMRAPPIALASVVGLLVVVVLFIAERTSQPPPPAPKR